MDREYRSFDVSIVIVVFQLINVVQVCMSRKKTFVSWYLEVEERKKNCEYWSNDSHHDLVLLLRKRQCYVSSNCVQLPQSKEAIDLSANLDREFGGGVAFL